MNSTKQYNDIQQFAKLVIFFANNSTGNLYKTKLNKLLFYAQFYHFKINKQVFFNNCYFIKDHFGPVFEELEVYLQVLADSDFIKLERTGFGQIIQATKFLNNENYTDNELHVLKKIINKFDGDSSYDISMYSHKESLWINSKLKERISLERADELNDF